MLDFQPLLDDQGVTIFDVRCRHRRGPGDATEQSGSYAIALVRRGCFTHRADGVETVLDPTLAYCMSPGQEHSYDHPHDGGDDCTSMTLSGDLLASIWGGELGLPPGAIAVSPGHDVEHRLLLAAARRDAPADELAERALGLVAALLRVRDRRRVDSGGRPTTADARRALVATAREALAADPARTLPDLASDLSVSPHHLSRIFRAETGETVARHRMRLRTRTVLERLAGGETDLARLAAETGFADQSHLCRVLRSETGTTPRALSVALAA